VKVSATAKYIRRSTRKTRLVTQAIVGRRVSEATAILRFMPQGAAKDVARVLKSAASNAENNHDLSVEDLVIVQATADEGPTIKRWKPRARGAAFPIHHPMTHVTIVVEDREAR
jgi:large subunit ribosomal protein L22